MILKIIFLIANETEQMPMAHFIFVYFYFFSLQFFFIIVLDEHTYSMSSVSFNLLN